MEADIQGQSNRPYELHYLSADKGVQGTATARISD